MGWGRRGREKEAEREGLVAGSSVEGGGREALRQGGGGGMQKGQVINAP